MHRQVPATRHSGIGVRWMRLLWLLTVLPALSLSAAASPPAEADTAPLPLQTRRLDNGLTVLVEERPDTLTVGVSLAIRAGSRDDNDERLGEVALIARALVAGTATRPSFDAVVEPLRAGGGRFGLSVSYDVTRFSVQAPATELDLALETLADIVINPRFSLAEMSGVLEDTLTGRYTAFDDRLAADLWPGHPAARPAGGVEKTLRALTFADLIALRARFYGARNMALAVVGPAPAADVLAGVERLFGALPPGERQQVRGIEPEPSRQQLRVLPSQRELATVSIAYPMPGRNSPEYPALVLLGLLVNGPDGLIFRDVRSGHGLARDADAQLTTFTDIGVLRAVSAVQPRNVEVTIARILDVFERLATEPVTEETLRRLRERYAGEALLLREIALNRSAELAQRAVLGEPIDDIVLLNALARVTPEDVRRLAARYLAPEHAIIHVSMPPA